MIRHVRVTTFTGSKYEVRYLDTTQQWLMRAENIPNPNSVALDAEHWWLIAHPAPWPPTHDVGMFLQAHRSLAYSDPGRIPMGGKWTSPVVNIEILEADGL